MSTNKDRIKRMIDRINNIKNHIKRKEKDYEIVTKKTVSKTTILNKIIEHKKNINILEECDILIVGGGPSGFRCNSSTNRIKYNDNRKIWMLSGVITTVGRTISWYRYEGTTDCQGIGIEMENS